jgi:hypothetical protein
LSEQRASAHYLHCVETRFFADTVEVIVAPDSILRVDAGQVVLGRETKLIETLELMIAPHLAQERQRPVKAMAFARLIDRQVCLASP